MKKATGFAALMGFRSNLAKSALKYAARKFDEYRMPRAEVRSDLGPVLARLDRIDRRLDALPRAWVSYAVLLFSFLAMVFALWALVRTF